MFGNCGERSPSRKLFKNTLIDLAVVVVVVRGGFQNKRQNVTFSDCLFAIIYTSSAMLIGKMLIRHLMCNNKG